MTPVRTSARQQCVVPPPSSQPVGGIRKRGTSGNEPPSTQPAPRNRGSVRKRVRGVDVIDLTD